MTFKLAVDMLGSEQNPRNFKRIRTVATEKY